MKKLLLLFSILFLSGCEDKIPKDFYVNVDKELIFAVHEEYFLNDFIKDTNYELLTENYQLDTNDTGTKKITLEFQNKKKTFTYDVSYEVVDLVEPKMFTTGTKTVYLGYDGDLCDYIMYGDNYDRRPTCEIIGEYKTDAIADFDITIKVSDSSGNFTEMVNTLRVIEEPTGSSNTPTTPAKVYFENVYQNYKNEKTAIGIDVSRWQEDIDWQKVKDAGAEFVMMRLGVQAKTEEDPTVDARYYENIQGAKAAGLKVGVYLYSMATSSDESIKQAKWLVEILNGEKLDLPIVFDWEIFSYWNDLYISFFDINNIAEVFIEEVKNAGYEGMLYSSKNYLETIWENKKDYPVWLAHYTSKTSYTGKYKIWQMTQYGRIDGINTDVDIDIMYLDS